MAMGCCTSGSAAKTWHLNPGGSSIVRATSSAGMGEPFSELKGAGKGSAESRGLRAERKRRERSMGMTNE
jgi:hypothetical protein